MSGNCEMNPRPVKRVVSVQMSKNLYVRIAEAALKERTSISGYIRASVEAILTVREAKTDKAQA